MFSGLFRSEQQPKKRESNNVYEDVLCRIYNSIIGNPERWNVAPRYSHTPATLLSHFDFYEEEIGFTMGSYKRESVHIMTPYELVIQDMPGCAELRDLVEKVMGMNDEHQAKVTSALLGHDFHYRFQLPERRDNLGFRSWFFHKCQGIYYVRTLHAQNLTEYDIRFIHPADAVLFKMEFTSAIDQSAEMRA